MKRFNTLILLLLLNSTLYSSDKLYSFIGVQTSLSNFDTTTVPSMGIKYGKQSNNVRTAVEYNYGKNGNRNYQTLLVKVDTGILPQLIPNKAIRPYVGGTLGIMQFAKDEPIDRGYLYGINMGLSYVLNDKLDLDLSYRFLQTASFTEIDSVNDLIFSVHYFY